MNYLATVEYAFCDRPGGSARVAWDIASEMLRAGHTVTTLAPYQDNALDRPEQSTHDGIRVVRYHRTKLPSWHPGRLNASIETARVATERLLAGEHWDLVHGHSLITTAGALAALPAETPLSYTVHSPTLMEQDINWKAQGWVGAMKSLFGRGMLRRLEHRVLARSTQIQTLSQFTRTQLQRFYGLGDRITVIPHWLRPELSRSIPKADARAKLGWPQNDRIVFTVRRLAERYGLDVAIKAIAPSAQAGRCRFYIGGGGPLKAQLEQLAAELNVSDRIQLLGRISDEDLLLAYQAADLFVLPTRALECFGLITQEALAFGIPVVGTDAGATPEILDQLAAGLVVPAGDVATLRAKIEQWLAGDLPAPASDGILDFVRSHYGRDVVVPRMIEFLEQAAQAPSTVNR